MLAVLDVHGNSCCAYNAMRSYVILIHPSDVIDHVNHLTQSNLSVWRSVNAAGIRKRPSNIASLEIHPYFCRQVSSLLLSSIAGL